MASRRRASRATITGSISEVQRRLRYLEGRPSPSRLGSLSVKTSNLQPRAVGNDQIALGAVTGNSIAANSIGSDNIGTDAIGYDELGIDAVDSENMRTDSVGTSELGIDAVYRENILGDAVGSGEIANDAVGSSEIAADSVGSSEIATDAVGSSEIGLDAVGLSELANDSVDTGAIRDGAVTDAKIYDVAGSKVTGQINTSVVPSLDASKITSGSFGSSRIANGAIIFGKIGDNAVGTSQLGGGAVTEPKIFDGAVTNTKLGFASVSKGKIASNAVGTSELISLSVTSGIIATGAVTSSKIGSQAVRNSELANNAVNFAKISSSAIGTGSSQVARGNHTHTSAAVPAHSHGFTGFSSVIGGAAHSHVGKSGAHNHGFTPRGIIGQPTTSTRKLKRDITDYTIDPKKLLALQLKQYKYKNSERRWHQAWNRDWMYGYIAEEVLEAGVEEILVYDEDGDPSGLNYDLLSTLIVELLKEHQSKIESLKEEIQGLKDEK